MFHDLSRANNNDLIRSEIKFGLLPVQSHNSSNFLTRENFENGFSA